MGRDAVYTVTVRRYNGRHMQAYTRNSEYSAKKLKRELEEKYDDTYYISIERK